MLEGNHRHQGENWSTIRMAVTSIAPTEHMILDLDDPPTGHRLAELLQALTGCSAERAELAMSDPTPTGPAETEDALAKMAQAMVRLRRAEQGHPGERGPSGS
jgi:hypothetical protein